MAEFWGFSVLDQYISHDLTILGARVTAVIDVFLTIGMYCAWFIRKSNQQQLKVQYMKVVYGLIGNAYHNIIWSPYLSLCYINLPYRLWADCRHWELGWSFIPDVQVSCCNHVSTGDFVEGDMLRPRKKKYILHLLNHEHSWPVLLQNRHTLYILPKTLHTSDVAPHRVGKAGHVWLLTWHLSNKNMICLYRCISCTWWIFLRTWISKVLGPRTHCAWGLCSQEFWGPKISEPVKDAEMR